MSAFDRTLASFFRSLATPSNRWRFGSSSHERFADEDEDWRQLRARGGQSQLEFYDRGLQGPDGALIVLKALEQNPSCDAIVLSQNAIGDNGLREILVGLKRLRPRNIGDNLVELNLSGCELTDISLHLIALHLLQSNPHKSRIAYLYLTANRLNLSKPVATFLGSAISSPASSLRCLSLTNNPIGTSGMISLLEALRLSGGPSQLDQLHLSVCQLNPDAAEPLARWLEDPNGGARQLQILCINGNNLSVVGIRRIRRAVASGRTTGLLHLEAHANSDYTAEWAAVVEELERQEALHEHTDELFERARKRNIRVLSRTRHSALALLATARILFCDDPIEADDLDPAQYFPFLRLPEELQRHVLRCLASSHPLGAADLDLSAGMDDGSAYSPLTETQFMRLVNYAASRKTLAEEIRIVKDESRRRSSRRDSQSAVVGDVPAWTDYALKQTRCDVFMPK